MIVTQLTPPQRIARCPAFRGVRWTTDICGKGPFPFGLFTTRKTAVRVNLYHTDESALRAMHEALPALFTEYRHAISLLMPASKMWDANGVMAHLSVNEFWL
jgi:hypothetical protein